MNAKKRILIILMVCCIPSAIYGQPTLSWLKLYGGDNLDEIWSMEMTPDSGFIMSGITRSFGAGLRDAWLIRTDKYGNQIWTREYGWSYDEFTGDLEIHPDGSYYVLGSTWSIGPGIQELFIRVDDSGDLIWLNTYGDLKNDYATSAVALPDGGFLVTGQTDLGSDNPHNDYLFVQRIDSGGVLLWTKSYGEPGQDFGIKIIEASDGGYVIAGFTAGPGFNDLNVWFVKVDAEGDTLWTKEYGGSGVELAEDVVGTPDGGYLIVGSTTSIGAGLKDIWLLKTDAFGDTLWTRTYGSNSFDEAYSVRLTKDNGFIIAGNRHLNNNEESKLYALRTDSSGVEIWESFFGEDNGRSYSAIQLSDGRYAIAGITSKFNNTDGALAEIVIKPTPVIDVVDYWRDSDADGHADVFADGSSSYNVEGYELTGYKWTSGGVTLGKAASVTAGFPNGRHYIQLTVEDVNFFSNTGVDSFEVYSQRIKTEKDVLKPISSFGDSIFLAMGTLRDIYSYSNNDMLDWTVDIASTVQSAAVIRDENLAYVPTRFNGIIAIDSKGETVFKTGLDMLDEVTPALGNNGRLYVGSISGKVYTIDGLDGSILDVFETGSEIRAPLIVRRDGVIYVPTMDGRIIALNQGGITEWVFAADSSINSPMAIDNEGNLCFASAGGMFYSVSSLGTESWRIAAGSEVRGAPVIDFEGNIYIGTSNGSFYKISPAGEILWEYLFDSAISSSGTALFTNGLISVVSGGKLNILDESGENVWVLQTNDKVKGNLLITDEGRIHLSSDDRYIYEVALPSALFDNNLRLDHQWPTFQGNNQRTGSNGILTDVNDDPSGSLPGKFSLSQSFPNPFNPETEIRFALPEAVNVTLKVYNIIGQEVQTLANGRYGAGYHTLRWAGKSNTGQAVASGVYLYRIKAGDFSQVRKMVYLK